MKKTLLIVYDEIEICEGLSELLESESRSIHTAANGFLGLDLLRTHEFDCVITDIRMPVLDGISFFRKARDRGFDVPFIFFSGHGTEDLRREMKLLGAHELVIKPNFSMLEEHVSQLLEAEEKIRTSSSA